MGKSTVPLTGRVPEPLKEEVSDLSEEEQMSQSAMVRELIKDGLARREEEDGGRERGRSVSPLALVGVVALAIAPTLLATGYTAVGLVAGVVAAAYVLLWVTAYDVLVEDALGDARDELAEVGGVVGFFRYVMTDGVVEEPDTVVERAANADLLSLGLFVAGLVVGAPAVVLARLGVLRGVLDAIGPTGVTVYLVVLVGLAYAGALMLGVSAVASLAIASTRTPDAADDAAPAE